MQAIVQALLLPVAQPLVHLNGGLMLMLHAWLLLLLWQRSSGAVPSVGAECVQEKNKLDQRRDEVHPHQQASLPHDSNVHSTVLRHKATEEKRNGKDLKQDARARAARSFASNDFGSKFAAVVCQLQDVWPRRDAQSRCAGTRAALRSEVLRHKALSFTRTRVSRLRFGEVDR
jgi:hypothetical protein